MLAFKVQRKGDNIFVDGLGTGSTKQIYAGQDRKDLAIETGQRAFFDIKKDAKTIIVSVVSRNDAVIKEVKFSRNGTKTIKIDPWDFIDAFEQLNTSQKNDGVIFRQGNSVVVRYQDKEKVFLRKPIFLPDEYHLAAAKYLDGKIRTIKIAPNGYSELKEDKCNEYGITPLAYEYAVASSLSHLTISAKHQFDGLNPIILHGASAMGVDLAAMNVATKHGFTQLGFSCPGYMMYVEDDDIPVYVARNQDEYCQAFTSSLDILIAYNGRLTAFSMDIDAVFKHQKYLMPINIIRAISTKGGPPALGPKGEVEDAVALFYSRLLFAGDLAGIDGIDSWDRLNQITEKMMLAVCRKSLKEPGIAYGYDWYGQPPILRK